MKTAYTVYYAIDFPKHYSLAHKLEDEDAKADVILNPDNILLTHRPVRVLVASDTEDVFWQMQGENWSPNGEARPLIKSLGLKHTSMSVGDVVVEILTNKMFLCMPSGFKEINQEKIVETKNKITKKVIEQYEQIRITGVCNMNDYICVMDNAADLQLYDLSSLSEKDYVYLISSYSDLMKKFKLKRR